MGRKTQTYITSSPGIAKLKPIEMIQKRGGDECSQCITSLKIKTMKDLSVYHSFFTSSKMTATAAYTNKRALSLVPLTDYWSHIENQTLSFI